MLQFFISSGNKADCVACLTNPLNFAVHVRKNNSSSVNNSNFNISYNPLCYDHFYKTAFSLVLWAIKLRMIFLFSSSKIFFFFWVLGFLIDEVNPLNSSTDQQSLICRVGNTYSLPRTVFWFSTWGFIENQRWIIIQTEEPVQERMWWEDEKPTGWMTHRAIAGQTNWSVWPLTSEEVIKYFRRF